MFMHFRGGGFGHQVTRDCDQALVEDVAAEELDNDDDDNLRGGEVEKGNDGEELEGRGNVSEDEEVEEEEEDDEEGDRDEGEDDEEEEAEEEDDVDLGAEDGEDPRDIVEEEGYSAL